MRKGAAGVCATVRRATGWGANAEETQGKEE
jgi:hypothetical protein